MSKIVNGTINVPVFSPTVNPGEYEITGATYNNQADLAGNGTLDIQPDFVIYVPASDPNTFMVIPGLVQRYRITSVTVIDQSTVDLIVIWDEPGQEQNAPTSGVECLITQTSENKGYGFITDPTLYPNMPSFVIPAAINNDIENITDVSTGSTQTYLHIQSSDSAIWTINHNKHSSNFVYTIFDDTGDQCLPNDVETINENTIVLHFLADMRGKVMFMFL